MKGETYHRENLREELIENGLKLFDAEGYDGFSLRKVAKACGVSHTAPYRHFKNKEELIAAIAAKALRQFNDCLKDAIMQCPGGVHEQIREMGCAYVRFFVENPEYLRLLFFSDLNRRIDVRRVNFSETLEKPEMIFYEAINRYIAERSVVAPVDKLESEALALGAWGLVHGIAVLIVQGDFRCEGDYMKVVRKIIWRSEVLD